MAKLQTCPLNSMVYLEDDNGRHVAVFKNDVCCVEDQDRQMAFNVTSRRINPNAWKKFRGVVKKLYDIDVPEDSFDPKFYLGDLDDV